MGQFSWLKQVWKNVVRLDCMKLKQENYRTRVAYGKNFKLRKDDIKMIK